MGMKQERGYPVRDTSKTDHWNEQTVLQTMAQLNDPLGVAGPYLLIAKVIFHDICDRMLGWDAELPQDLKNWWEKWLNNLPGDVTFSKSIPRERKRVVKTEIYIHGFSDASILGRCAVVYKVRRQGEVFSRTACIQSQIG